MIDGMARFVPREAGYRHSEGNSDAHIKTSLIGSHVAVPVEDGRLRLGTWQSDLPGRVRRSRVRARSGSCRCRALRRVSDLQTSARR